MKIDTHERLPLTLRSVSLREFVLLRRLQRGGVQLDHPAALVSGYRPIDGLMRGRWNPLPGLRYRTYIAATGRMPLAVVQVREQPSLPRTRWELVYLGALRNRSLRSSRRQIDLWAALLDYLTATAGRRGVQRLYAKATGDSDAGAALHQAGYTRYGEETIYQLDLTAPADVAAAPIPALREQTPGDTWALHQLYTLTAPKTVQYAEAHTSQDWELPTRKVLAQRAMRTAGFVVDHEHGLAIYCRVQRQQHRACLEFVYDPAARDELAATIHAVVEWLKPAPGDQIYCTVRAYQAELAGNLQMAGFVAREVQDLLVRYTTVALRTPALRVMNKARDRNLLGVPVGSLQRQV